jgi:hypothetical protein
MGVLVRTMCQAQPASCRHLRRITITECSRLRDHHLAPLAHCPPCLTMLSFSKCAKLTPTFLQKLPLLPELSVLHFMKCAPCSDKSEFPFDAAIAPSLTELSLAEQPNSTKTAEGVIGRLAHLVNLDLSWSSISQEGVNAFTALTELTRLILPMSGANYPPPLARLKVLDMSHCLLEGAWQEFYAISASLSGTDSIFHCLEELTLASCVYGEARSVIHGHTL